MRCIELDHSFVADESEVDRFNMWESSADRFTGYVCFKTHPLAIAPNEKAVECLDHIMVEHVEQR